MNDLHVMVAILRDRQGRVLISQRPDGKIQAGRWEFPGGKLESGEDRLDGLQRELREELGVAVDSASPLIQIRHCYPGFSVFLDVMDVTRWRGTPEGLEGQELKWVYPDELMHVDLLEADIPIVNAVRLPDTLLITPAVTHHDRFLVSLENSFRDGICLVQFRGHELDDDSYIGLGKEILELCRSHGVQLLLNRHPRMLERLEADGIHLTARLSREFGSRPVPENIWFSVSCHDEQELADAAAIGADYCLLGSIRETGSHPGKQPLGWDVFTQLVGAASIPVFALGGMTSEDIHMSRTVGGQGVAGIRGFWKG